jgi:salicylate hydroxylase
MLLILLSYVASFRHPSRRLFIRHIQPSSSQAVAMAIGDAAMLGGLFSHIGSNTHIPTLLSAYEDLRQTRCADIQATERRKVEFLSLPAGSSERAQRDAGFRETMEHGVLSINDSKDEIVSRHLSHYVRAWSYDAYEAVEDWWTKWGGILEKGQGSTDTKVRKMSVTEVKMQVEKTEALLA